MKFALKSLYACLSLLAFAVLVTACGLGKHSGLENGKPRYLYAQIKGELQVQSRIYKVDRVFVADDSLKLKMVVSSITVVDDVNGFVNRFSKQLYEYCFGDSLYVFDSSDSSFIALNLMELQGLRTQLLPYSASWIFDNSLAHNLSNDNPIDTIWHGLECKYSAVDNLSSITFRDYNLTLQCHDSQFTQNEALVKMVVDTVLVPEVFTLPLGFKKMQNSGQNGYSFFK